MAHFGQRNEGTAAEYVDRKMMLQIKIRNISTLLAW